MQQLKTYDISLQQKIIANNLIYKIIQQLQAKNFQLNIDQNIIQIYIFLHPCISLMVLFLANRAKACKQKGLNAPSCSTEWQKIAQTQIWICLHLKKEKESKCTFLFYWVAKNCANTFMDLYAFENTRFTFWPLCLKM